MPTKTPHSRIIATIASVALILIFLIFACSPPPPVEVTREVPVTVEVTREVEVTRVVTREVTRVVTVVVQPPTTLKLPTAQTETTDCDLAAWQPYLLEITPLSEGFLNPAFKANELLASDNLSPADFDRAKILWMEAERSAAALPQIKPPVAMRALHLQLISAARGYLEATQILVDIANGVTVSESRENRGAELYETSLDKYANAALAIANYPDTCNETAGRAASNVVLSPTPAPTRPSVTPCNFAESRAYFVEMMPIAIDGLDAFQRTEELIDNIDSNPFAVQDPSWRRRMESALDDMDTWATATINIRPPHTMSEAHQSFEAAAKLYMDRITPNIRRGIKSIDPAPIRSAVADAYQAADLLNAAVDYVEDYLERCD